jgi:serine/threonine protein kinase
MAEFGVDIPPAVEGIVRKCLRKEPDERYQDAGALLHDLEHWRELDTDSFAFADEESVPPAGEHLLLLVAGICIAFLAGSTLLLSAAYFVQHR